MVEMKAHKADVTLSVNGKKRKTINSGGEAFETHVTSDVVEIRVEVPERELANDNVLEISSPGGTVYFGIRTV